ncbi:MAG: polysaccharide pyruvyl transferase family protein [Candidatus Bathyarchaeota archaeon]|nr:polysaccharide pyruvyl transferase family protein [Candidatus Bathyarchaeota archaeon]
MIRLLIYGGWYGSGNLGDDAILIGLRNLLSKVIPDVEIAALSIDVSQTRRVCNVEAFPLKSPRELLTPRPGLEITDYRRHFEWADACILTGGTPIYDYDHISRIIHCRLPRLLGKELICFGIGVKPVRSFHGKRLVRWLLKDAAAVSTRDPSSERELRKMGFESEIRVTGDSALFLDSEAGNTATLEELGLGQLKHPIAICPRALSPDHRAHYHAPLTHATITKLRKDIATVADRLTQTGYDVVFIPMHQAPGDDDTAEITKIREMMNETSAVTVYPGSPQKAMWILGRMKLVLGLRLHSLILAATAGVPIVGINHDPKIRGFMEHAGTEDYLSGVEDPPEALIHQIEKALDNRTSMKRRLLDSCERMRAKIIDESQRIAEIINRER